LALRIKLSKHALDVIAKSILIFAALIVVAAIIALCVWQPYVIIVVLVLTLIIAVIWALFWFDEGRDYFEN
jgi:hypothetical protein